VAEQQRVPILMYHEVATGTELAALRGKTQHGYIVTRERFHAHMSLLHRLGAQAIDLNDVLAWRAGRAALPPKPVVITFDDGFAGNERHALPILAEFGFPATFFVISNKVGDPLMMTKRQLRALADAGMAIQSHTANHPLLSKLDASQTRVELADSKQTLEDIVGQPVRHISLPNGDSNVHYRQLAGETGYLTGCGSAFGLNDRSADVYFLRRIAVKADTPASTVGGIVSGDERVLRRLAAIAGLKGMIPRLLGKSRYDRLYNFVFGVEQQEKKSNSG
jgi:peptidoglycan/xylan/chitin deacetylase (PgdA/CDA1 family)